MRWHHLCHFCSNCIADVDTRCCSFSSSKRCTVDGAHTGTYWEPHARPYAATDPSDICAHTFTNFTNAVAHSNTNSYADEHSFFFTY